MDVDLTPQDEREWYERNGCTHAHCPDGCEHPQPFMMGGKLVCGRCWFKYGKVSEMVPCTPDLCD